MLALHIALYCLLGTGFLFAIIELGLGGYVVSQWSGVTSVCDGYGFYCEDVKVSTPGILSFLIFTAVWTMLVSVAAVVLPFFFARKGNVTPKLNMILGIATIITFFITCVFWLACFADIVTIYSASNTWSDYLNAVVAFAVLLWLIFMALVILSILTAVGVLLSSWPGYQSMRQDRAPQGTGPPVNDVPMSTAPAAAPVPVHAHPHAHHDNVPAPVAVPSELSARDAEALHDQAPSQSHSISSPSAVTSVELDGGNGQKY